MPRIERDATVVWEGSSAGGGGRISAATGAFHDLPYSLPTRTGEPNGETGPEELLAAAHAGCWAMSLAGELTALRSPPVRLDVSCRVLMDEVEGQGHQIVASTISAAVELEQPLPDDELADAARRADEGCPFSALLKRAGASVDANVELLAP